MKLRKPSDLDASISRKRAAAIQAMGGYAISVVAIVQGLLLVPMYLHHIGAHLYGLWLASGGILNMMGMFNFGISSLVVQRVAQAYGQDNFPRAGAYFINGVAVYMFISSAFILTGMVLSLWLPQMLGASRDNGDILRYCFQISVIAFGVGIINECLRGFSQALLRPGFSMGVFVSGRIVGIAITVVLLLREEGLWAIPLGMISAEIAIFVFNLIYTIMLLRGLGSRLSIKGPIIREYLRLGPALLLGRVGYTLSKESDPLLIALILSPESTTVYMVTRRAADIVFQMLSVLNSSMYGAFCHLAGQEEAHGRLRAVASWFVFSMFALSLIGFSTYVAGNYAFVSLWVGNKYALHQSLIILIGIVFFVSISRNAITQVLNGLGDFSYPSWIVFMEGTAKIVLSIAFLIMFGIKGLPIAAGAVGLVAFLLVFLRMQRILDMHGSAVLLVKNILKAVVVFGIAQLIFDFVYPSATWEVFVIHIAAAIFLLAIISALLNWGYTLSLFRRYLSWSH